MKTVFITFLFTLCFFGLDAQISKGHIRYNRKTDYISIVSKLPYMTQEDIDRMELTMGKWNRDGENYDLYFENQKTLYTRVKDDTGGRSWGDREFTLMRDYRSFTQEDVIETLGKVYHLEEDLTKTKWKILNEIKEVAGYICMKAETTNEEKGQVIHAWFTDAIPFSGGPEGYGGLPGMIMEININEADAVITATEVNLEAAELKIPYPKKIKGKKISKTDYDKMVKKYISEQIEGKRNPYWRVRY